MVFVATVEAEEVGLLALSDIDGLLAEGLLADEQAAETAAEVPTTSGTQPSLKSRK